MRQPNTPRSEGPVPDRRRKHAPRIIWGRTHPMVAALLLMATAFSTVAPPRASAYDYPVRDALLATVIGTAVADQRPVPAKVPTRMRSLELFPDRETPRIFWNQNELRYSVSAQKTDAPLIFIVAGTGASYNSGKMLFLHRLFFSEGFHVI
jgi:hypothetical protein